MKIIILGASGLLGNTFYDYFNKKKLKKKDIYFTLRESKKSFLFFDANKQKTFEDLYNLNPDFIINCIGVIKPHINENSIQSIMNAFKINSELPKLLNFRFPKSRIIHFNTDCVYNGFEGGYFEDAPHSYDDIYGMSKSLGEIYSDMIMNIRCSIIGREKNSCLSLLSWFLKNKSKQIDGYINHYWNGLTTNSLVKIVDGIISNNLFRPGKFHIIPKDKVSKYDMLEIFNKKFHKNKHVNKVCHEKKIDRSLNTNFKDFNKILWNYGGYDDIPTIEEMINEIN